jgi:tight adherence protein B
VCGYPQISSGSGFSCETNMFPVIIALFLCVSCLVAGALLWLARGKSTPAEVRLQSLTAVVVNPTGAESPDYVRSLVQTLKKEQQPSPRLDQLAARICDLRPLIAQAGLEVAPGTVVLLCLALALAGAALGCLAPAQLVIAPAVGIAVGSTPMLWIWFKRRRRLGAFERQLPEALELLGRSLRSGHSLVDGMRLVADEMSDPIAKEFSRCHERQQLGARPEEALREMGSRVPLSDLRYFVTAIVLQRQTGGDIVEVLDKIGHLIRERVRIRGQIKALTGEGRLSGVVLVALPFCVGGYLFLQNPDYIMLLFRDPLGQKMAAGAITSLIIGTLAIKKIVDIRV